MTNVSTPSPWIVRFNTSPSPRLRLVCFPYSGGSPSAFGTWSEALPNDVELCAVSLPGRQSRFREPAISRMEELIAGCLPSIKTLLDRPCVFFGHSLGSLVAFETVRCLLRESLPLPRRLIVSARRAPPLPLGRPPIAHLDDEKFVQAVDTLFQGIPREALASPELLELVVPALRADVTLGEAYVYAPGPSLICPIEAWYATGDQNCSEAQARAWSEQTNAAFELRAFDGGHMFIASARAHILARLNEILANGAPL